MKKRKTLVALALATAATGFALPARADMTSCWHSRDGQEDLVHFKCDHTISKDSRGWVWHKLVYAHNRKGVRIAVFYDEDNLTITRGVMTMLDGSNRVETTAWTDSDGDLRIDFRGLEIAWRPSKNPQIASLRPGSGIRTVSRRTTRRNVEIEELLQGL